MRESTVSERAGQSLPSGSLERIRQLLADVPAAARRHGLLIGVSGGADSTALALLLGGAGLRGLWGPVRICHLDHAQRPAAADAEAAVVRRLAAQLKMPLVTRRLALPPGSSELRMRDARHAALHDLARTHGAGAVALGHHADDQIETLLFRHQRGTGIRGLAGMPHRRALVEPSVLHHAGSSNHLSTRNAALCISLLRPLLGLRRADTLAVCQAAGAPSIDDPSNRDLRQSRAHIRHVDLPRLRSRDPLGGAGFDAGMLAIASAARQVTARTEALAAPFDSLFTENDGDRQAPAAIANPEHGGPSDAVLREILRRAWLRIVPDAPRGAWLSRAVALRRAPPGRRLSGRGPGLDLMRSRTGLALTQRPSTPS